MAYLAAAKVGAATAGVNPRLTPAEQKKLLDLAEPTLVLDDAGAVDELRIPGGDGADALADDPDRPVAIVFTSGTTGTPKGAVFADRQLAAITAIDVGDTWGGGGRMLAGTSFAHVGFMTKLPWYLRRGTHDVPAATAGGRPTRCGWSPTSGMTSVGGMPTQLALMLRVPDFDDHDLSCVRDHRRWAAGPSTPALVREARARFGAPLVDALLVAPRRADRHGHRVRRPPTRTRSSASGARTRASSVDDRRRRRRAVPTGEVGEVCLRSPAVMGGYWRDPEATAAAFTADGWVRTGDLGWIDDAGRLRLVGRSKEMYIRGGYNVYPVEVEAVLAEHPAWPRCHRPAPDDVMGESASRSSCPRDPARPPSLDDLRAFARRHLVGVQAPRGDLRVVDALPLTAMEKLDRNALKTWAVGSAP